MRKVIFTIFCVLLFISVKAQFTVSPGEWKLITIDGRDYKIFVPADYATGSNYYFHVAFYGNGITDAPMMDTEEPGNFLNDNSTNWNGEVHMNDLSVAKFIILGIPNYGYNIDIYSQAIDSVFKVLGNKVDTSNHNYFSCSGFSGGSGRMWGYLTNDGNLAPGPYRLIFQNTISMSTVTIGVDVAARSAPGRHWVWYSSIDPNGGTRPFSSHSLYNSITGTKLITDYPVDCHCGIIWDSCMSITGTGIINGGTAVTNRWRWLVNPNDSVITDPLPLPGSPPPVVRPPSVTSIRVSPNPAGKTIQLYWEIDKSSPAEVRIIDMKGTVMYRKEMMLTKGYRNDQLTIQSWSSGLYFLQVYKEKKIFTVPFVKH